MGVHYYCPYCGMTQFKTNTVCIQCHNNTEMKSSKMDSKYYQQKSMNKYGDLTHWREFLLPELKDNQLFNEELFSHQIISSEPINTAPNLPKCPTCGSTNIKKISDLRRGVHGLAWGILSKTARSQFECKNCGYKW